MSSITWKPSPEHSKEDRIALSNRLDHSTRVLVRVLEPQRLEESTETLKHLISLEMRGAPAILHPDFFHWYNQLVAHAKTKPLSHSGIATHLEELHKLPEVIQTSWQRAEQGQSVVHAIVDIDPDFEGARASLSRGEASASFVSDAPVHLDIVEDWMRDLTLRVRDAFDLIRDIWPEAYNEAQDFVRKFMVFRGPAVIGFTDFKYHGAIFLKHDQLVTSKEPSEIAEEILHEAAHVRLNALLAVKPLFTNGSSELYSSPLRRDPRPMFGVFHQMYVLTRLSHFYDRLRSSTDPGEKYSNSLSHIFSHLKSAFEVVDTHGKLTDAGTSLIKSIRTQITHLDNQLA